MEPKKLFLNFPFSENDVEDIADLYGFPTTLPVIKDWCVIRLLQEILKIELNDDEDIVFCGGTCMSKTIPEIKRMSEDIDLKIVFKNNINSNNKRKNKRKKFIVKLKKL